MTIMRRISGKSGTLRYVASELTFTDVTLFLRGQATKTKILLALKPKKASSI